MEFLKWNTWGFVDGKPITKEQAEKNGDLSYLAIFKIDDSELEGLDDTFLDYITSQTREVSEDLGYSSDKNYIRIVEDNKIDFRRECIDIFCQLLGTELDNYRE
jgi:hypothetical protein